MRFVISPAEPVCLSIAGSDDLFPVNRAFCIGRNYADHAIEMGGNPDREEPFFFMKPAGSRKGTSRAYSRMTLCANGSSSMIRKRRFMTGSVSA